MPLALPVSDGCLEEEKTLHLEFFVTACSDGIAMSSALQAGGTTVLAEFAYRLVRTVPMPHPPAITSASWRRIAACAVPARHSAAAAAPRLRRR